jgi:hypothetical protein
VSSLPVKPELGPTLPDLAGPRWHRLPRAARLALSLLVALLVVLLAARVLGGGAGAGETPVVVREPVGFNLRFGPGLERVDPEQGELLRLVDRRRTERFLQSFTVMPLTLRPYRGLAGGELPVAAEALKTRLGSRFDDFRLVEEGRTRINEVPGYEVVFSARGDDGRRLYGRWVMMLPLTDPPTPQTRGVVLALLGTFAAGIPNVDSVGDQGQLKLALRSFRFGTEAP